MGLLRIQKQRFLYGFVWFSSIHLNGDELQYLTQSMDRGGAVPRKKNQPFFSHNNPYCVKKIAI